jgi:hypothetical protein
VTGEHAVPRPPRSGVRTVGVLLRPIGALGFIGLGAYLGVVNTTLSLRAGACCFYAVALATFIVPRARRAEGQYGIWTMWSSVGTMLLLVMWLVIACGQDRHWQPGTIRTFNTVADWVLTPAILCALAVALIMMWPAAQRQLMRLVGRG